MPQLRPDVSQGEKQRHVGRALIGGIGTAGGVVGFALALFYTYKLKVAPLYSYSGLRFTQPDLDYYSMAILLVVGIAVILPRRIERVSDFILWVVFVLAAAPSILIAQHSGTLARSEATKMGLAVAGTTAMVIILVRSIRPWSFKLKRLNTGIDFWVILGGFSFFLYTYLIFTTGLRLQSESFVNVYGLRAEFGAAASGSVIIGYFLPVQTNVVNPLLLAKGIYARKPLPLLAGGLGQIVIFSSTGQKSILFSVVAVSGIALLFRIYRERPPGIAILVGITATSTLALVVDRLTGATLWTSLMSRRLMIIPGALTAAYVKVFHDKPRMNFAEIFPFVDNPYSTTRPVNIVGAEYVGNASTAANVNLFGHGYLNMGYIGMFAEGLVLVVLLLMANAATRELPIAVASIAFLGAALSLVSSSVFTAALTHGFLVAIAVCALAPSTGWHRPALNGHSDLNRPQFVRRHQPAAQPMLGG